jgi:hypothetical protein
MLCLANSRKLAGRRVAGKEWARPDLATWVRPMSSQPGGALSAFDRQYENGDDPDILDIVKIEMRAPCPEAYQTENHLIDENYYWQRVGRGTWEQVLRVVDAVAYPLWTPGHSSTNGINDRVPAATANTMTHSLVLIRPNTFSITVSKDVKMFHCATRQVRGSFSVANFDYNLRVTDPYIEGIVQQYPDGEYSVPSDVLLCISLGEIFRGFAYKLIATVIYPERWEAAGE